MYVEILNVTFFKITFIAVISFALIILLHWMTAVISYFIMIITALICVGKLLMTPQAILTWASLFNHWGIVSFKGFTAFMWWTYASIKMQLDSTDRNMLLNEMVRNESAFLSYSIISTIFTFLLILIVVYLRNRVRIVVRLFREAGSALLAMPCLVIQPFLTYLSLTAFFCAWLYIVLCLATADEALPKHVPFYPQSSSGEFDLFNSSSNFSMSNGTMEDGEMSNSNDTSADIPEAQAQTDIHSQNRSVSLSSLPTFTLIEYSGSIWVKYLWWIYIVGLIWCSEFILGCQQMVIASSVAAWYFSRWIFDLPITTIALKSSFKTFFLPFLVEIGRNWDASLWNRFSGW